MSAPTKGLGDRPDAELVPLAKRGDPAARDELARRHLPLLARLVRRYVPERDADDVAQRAMLRGLDRLEGFREESAFRSWLHRIAVNLALNHLRDHKRVVVGTEIDEADLITNSLGPARLVAQEGKVRLLAALGAPPAQQRRSVELRLLAEHSFAEVAAQMGISEDSAKANYHHAMKRLRAHLDGDG